jgi:putative transposase
MSVASVNPHYTSKNCSRCGLRDVRRHTFTCPPCGYSQHADVNAAFNIRNRFTQLRLSGLPSMSPEAQSSDMGKPPAFFGGH